MSYVVNPLEFGYKRNKKSEIIDRILDTSAMLRRLLIGVVKL